MNKPHSTETVQRPIVTGKDAREELLRRATRRTVPLRKTFVQALPGSKSRRGPLHTFVVNSDLRGLRAYLIVVAATSAANEDGWSTTLDSLVWARLLDAEETTTQAAARTAAWRTLGRLQDRKLISRVRSARSSRAEVRRMVTDGRIRLPLAPGDKAHQDFELTIDGAGPSGVHRAPEARHRDGGAVDGAAGGGVG